MAIDFPNSPANNEIFSYNNKLWIWSEPYGVWRSYTNTSIATIVAISETPPGSPSSGNIWWNSNTGGLYIYYSDGTSSQWVEATPRKPAASSPFGYSIIFGGF